jgi:hypothetical protein
MIVGAVIAATGTIAVVLWFAMIVMSRDNAQRGGH